ncbi:MAG: hypothetical protein [Caudoviricetes sp.]|nr:MAG: hypothetical protein [Caudoviricetes sp.]
MRNDDFPWWVKIISYLVGLVLGTIVTILLKH